MGDSTIVQSIADKFNLNKDEVQAVFDQNKQARGVKMQAKFDDQLSQYVKDGKITEAQKQLILNKRKELEATRQANKDANKNLTPAERKTKVDAKRKELETWATQNGIDIQYLMLSVGIRGGWHGK